MCNIFIVNTVKEQRGGWWGKKREVKDETEVWGVETYRMIRLIIKHSTYFLYIFNSTKARKFAISR